MSNISKVDKNFVVKTSIEKEDISFYDIEQAPFTIYGVFKENGKYRRLPETVAKEVNDGVHILHTNTAGGRVRFVTNSQYIAISCKMNHLGKMPHIPFTGAIGLDLYADDVYEGTFLPPFSIEGGYDSILEFEEYKGRKERVITVNLPLYSGVNDLYIGLEEGANLKKAPEYKVKKPVVYYGSSITQGGCASRPGRSYQSVVSREFDCDYINLGFSGSARGEDAIADYIKNLDMSLFVYDYDHNAPTVDRLRNTHERMFKRIREEKPDIPIIMMSRPKFYLTPEEEERLEIIRTTYNNALLSGDKKVYLIENKELTRLCKDEGTVDGCHPTDFGFASMAEALIKTIKEKNIL